MPQVNDQGAGSLALTPCRNVVKPTTSAAYVSFLFRCYSKPETINPDDPDTAKAITATWGPRVKDDARFWLEL